MFSVSTETKGLKMAHNGMARLFGAWRMQDTASTLNFSQQENAKRWRCGLNVRQQRKLIGANGANRKVLLGRRYRQKFIYPRGSAWERVAELSGL
jgi:hypothetical protein